MILLFIIGTASGFISGMGIGGGVILIPALTILLGLKQQAAQQISLIYFIPTALISVVTHKKEGNIQKGVALRIVLFGLIGAAAGAFIAVRIDESLLRRFFGAFLLILGIYEFRKGRSGQEE